MKNSDDNQQAYSNENRMMPNHDASFGSARDERAMPHQHNFNDVATNQNASHERFPESGVNNDRRNLHSGKGPRSYKRSDERLQEIVCERLTDDRYVDASNIEITVKNCEVILTGSVNDRATKRRVEDLIESISGITQVENLLRVSQQSADSFKEKHADLRSENKETFR